MITKHAAPLKDSRRLHTTEYRSAQFVCTDFIQQQTVSPYFMQYKYLYKVRVYFVFMWKIIIFIFMGVFHYKAVILSLDYATHKEPQQHPTTVLRCCCCCYKCCTPPTKQWHREAATATPAAPPRLAWAPKISASRTFASAALRSCNSALSIPTSSDNTASLKP